MKTRFVLILIFILGVVRTITASYTMNKETLPQKESEQALDACGKCHRNPDRLNTENVHHIHQAADCTTCHIGNTELESAADTLNTITWTGIGIAGITIIMLATNYFVAKKRLASNVNDNESRTY